MLEPKIFHVYNKSIYHFTIFNDDREYERFMLTTRFYQFKDHPGSLSVFLRESTDLTTDLPTYLAKRQEKLVKIIAYCLMPTHIHFVLESLRDNGIAEYMRLVCNSYSRFFNEKHGRRGPLWQGKYKKKEVLSDEQYLYLTRYVHRNPVKALIVEKPEAWKYSSFKEFIGTADTPICEYNEFLDIKSAEYMAFVHSDEAEREDETILTDLVLD
jgi:putative transposase